MHAGVNEGGGHAWLLIKPTIVQSMRHIQVSGSRGYLLTRQFEARTYKNDETESCMDRAVPVRMTRSNPGEPDKLAKPMERIPTL